MTSAVMGGLEKPVWRKALSALAFVAAIGIAGNFAIISLTEGNNFSWFGVVAVIGGLIALSMGTDEDDLWRRAWYFVATIISFAFFLVSPYVHVATQEKVWIVDGKTSLKNATLIRSPFAPIATSVQIKQNLSVGYWETTKDGVAVSGLVSGHFRVTDDEEMIVSRFSKGYPDFIVKKELTETLDKLFEKTVSRKTAAEIAALPSSFALELDVGDGAAAIKQLGLKRNGTILVSDIHPYFVDK